MRKWIPFFLPVTVLALALFYLLPALFMSASLRPVLVFLFLIDPLFFLFSSFFHSLRFGFHWIIPVYTAVLFIPSVFLFYNDSVLIYAAVYLLLSFLGEGTGTVLKKRPKGN